MAPNETIFRLAFLHGTSFSNQGRLEKHFKSVVSEKGGRKPDKGIVLEIEKQRGRLEGPFCGHPPLPPISRVLINCCHGKFCKRQFGLLHVRKSTRRGAGLDFFVSDAARVSTCLLQRPKPTIHGPSGDDEKLTIFDTRALRASLGKRAKTPHADFPFALAGLRNVV